jgi:hypothetical protein
VEQNPESVKEKNKDGSLPLHAACHNKASLDVVQYLVEQYPDSIYVKDKWGPTPLNAAERCVRSYGAHEEVVNWLNSYLTSRWVRAGKLILLRALVDQGRARLMETSHSLIADGKNGTFGTSRDLDLIDFLFRTSPDGIFASIMLYL